jgi:CHAT domain-containing protein
MPLGALRPEPTSQPLAASHQISVAPSATLWLRLQKSGKQKSNKPALVLADPVLPMNHEEAEFRSAGIFHRGLELGRLPHAGQEGSAVVERLGGKSRLLLGADASEHRLKKENLDDYGLLHLAAHAVVDDQHPHRSAVVLSPGAESEDGLLQSPEIAEMDMQGLVVILSTCSSARGEVLEGEGVLSLARSFFQAGARAVVGNLWRLRDDEAAALVDDLATGLSKGESLGGALAATQNRWIHQGRPAAAWAGLLLQGDADFVPFPGGIAGGTPGWVWLLAGALVLTAAVLLVRRRAR